ncbi:MAG TPA: hypothetical protein PLD88_04080, partial [Candidatus Berkiella sp.]|nr:hypothetical protein [Candidatus Berkiella sp.]
AAGIMGSAIAGDESLHVGQFMAIVDKDGHIEGIKRIDLGARERFAVARAQSKTEPPTPYNASKYYRGSGQCGKDYVSYLLAEPTLRKMYTMLWVNLSTVPELERQIIQGSQDAFIQQFQVIPEALRANALAEVLSTINNSAKLPIVLKSITLDAKIQELAGVIADMDARRVSSMVRKGQEEYLHYTQKIEGKISSLFTSDVRQLCSESIRLQELLIKTRAFSLDSLKETFARIKQLNKLVKGLVSQVNQKSSNELLSQIQLLTELGSDLVHAATLNFQYNPELSHKHNPALNAYLDKLQTINNAATYCLGTRSEDKIPYVTRIMEKAISGNNALASYIQNQGLIDTLKAHGERYSLKSHAQGELLLLNIYKRYHLNDKLVTMTRAQRDLIVDIKAGNFAKVAVDVANLTVDDVISADELGKT